VSLCALALASLTPAPAAAASKEIERLLIQMANLQQQVGDLGRIAADNAREIKRLSDLVGEQNAALKKTIQDQKLQDEALQATLKEVSERLGDMRDRSSTPASSPAVAAADPGAPGAPPAAFPPTSVAAAGDIFSQAYADCSRGNYDVGIQGFKEFLRVYPNTERSDNAQYWIGECLYGKGAFAEANDAWQALLHDYPSSDKLPDTHVKKGLALEKLHRGKEAVVEFRYVLDHYPNSEAAKIAKSKLNPQ
jgi:tol-pal system protein YbgF